MGIEAVGSATYFPTAQIGVPSSNYKTPSPAIGISGSPAPVANGMDNTLSSSGESDSDEDLDQGRGGPSSSPTNTRKRKRRGTGGGSTSRSKMMCLFQGLMKQVVDKQEAMKQRFLETIEKREQDRRIREDAWRRQEMAMQQRFLETIEKTEQERTVREEAWKCQEMDRLTLEHEMMAQDREISASRHATVVALLQKISGQNIQFSYPAIIPAAPPLQPQSISPPTAPVPPPPQPKQHRHHHIVQHQPQQQKPQSSKVLINHNRQPTSTDHEIIAVPEQQHSPAQEMGSAEFSSKPESGWQEREVLSLIQLRSGLDSRYGEAGPKKEGLLWAEISAEMRRMGYSRSGKKCSEKWMNIISIFRKLKGSKDATTWPYFHQLDALYGKKVHGGSNQTYQDSPIDHNQSSYTSSSTVDPNTYDSAETNINNNSNSGGGSYIN